MTMDPLDDFLLTITDSSVRDVKRMLKVLRDANTCGVPPLMAKSITDRLKQSGGFEFYLGTPPDELRRIASFVLTKWAGSEDKIPPLLCALWKRHGREDMTLYGILLANIDPILVGGNPWNHFADRLGRKEPADNLLAVCEEVVRAGYSFPEESVLIEWAVRTRTHHHLAVFILFMRNREGGELSGTERILIESCPNGNDLISRISERLLRA